MDSALDGERNFDIVRFEVNAKGNSEPFDWHLAHFARLRSIKLIQFEGNYLPRT